MILVIQRVNKAKVEVGGNIVGEIGKGLFVLFGARKGDSRESAHRLAEKLSKMRIMADDQDKMNLSVMDTDAQVLVVSQFTLYADTSKGNRPSFIKAEDPDKAEKLYDYFVEQMVKLGVKTETGSFGDYMLINAQMDGPVTITIEDEG